jgi:hypothetical protein
MGRATRRILVVAAVGAIGVSGVLAERGVGRRFWHPYYRAMAGSRTHAEVLSDVAPRRRPALAQAAAAGGVAYPPRALTLVGLKQERRLEAWAAKGAGFVLLRSYPVLAASGGPGPKLREGDLQVPEGVYRLTHLNPASSYHLSIRVDYPNADDRAGGRAEGRTNLGGDIYIHGKSVSIGCLAIGDDAIEELYVLLADVGLANVQAILVPGAEPLAARDDPRWVADLYDRLRRELQAVRGLPR